MQVSGTLCRQLGDHYCGWVGVVGQIIIMVSVKMAARDQTDKMAADGVQESFKRETLINVPFHLTRCDTTTLKCCFFMVHLCYEVMFNTMYMYMASITASRTNNQIKRMNAYNVCVLLDQTQYLFYACSWTEYKISASLLDNMYEPPSRQNTTSHIICSHYFSHYNVHTTSHIICSHYFSHYNVHTTSHIIIFTPLLTL